MDHSSSRSSITTTTSSSSSSGGGGGGGGGSSYETALRQLAAAPMEERMGIVFLFLWGAGGRPAYSPGGVPQRTRSGSIRRRRLYGPPPMPEWPAPLDDFVKADAPRNLTCPISLQLQDDPVMLLTDGRTYSRASIEAHLAHCRSSELVVVWLVVVCVIATRIHIYTDSLRLNSTPNITPTPPLKQLTIP